MKNLLYILTMAFGVAFLLTSCLKDLDTVPLDEKINSSEKVYADPENYKEVLAKCYLGLATGGQGGEGGGDAAADISGIDGGFSQYTRQLWYHQEFTTDEAIVAWNDQTIKDFHYQTWGTSDVFISAMYYRIMFQVTMTNEFIKNTQPGALDDRGIGGEYRDEFAVYQSEARFLRALSYWHGLDMFRNMPFITEDDPIGATFPTQVSPVELFNYIESELVEISDGEGSGDLLDPKTNEYARADKASAWMVLAKLYLNAEVYIGESKYDKAIEVLEKIIAAGYSLEPEHENLFRTDNFMSDEIIFPVALDGISTQTWGGTTLLVHASVGGTMGVGKDANGEDVDSTAIRYGINSGWGGFRTTKELVYKFEASAYDPNDATKPIAWEDKRAVFYTDGQNLEIDNVGLFTDGYAVPKFLNISSTGEQGVDLDFVDTDYPMFRLGDAYLMYAEAQLRGGGGDAVLALQYVNALRERAYGDASGNITAAELDLQFIIDERARELLWEGHRRTDLVRFGLFTGDAYLWEWKGFLKNGIGTDSYRDIFPIPANDLNANPNLKQNGGYN